MDSKYRNVRWVVDDATARKLVSADLGLFAAILGSGAPFDILCTTAKFFAWVVSLKYVSRIISNYLNM
ncbi:terpenoid synthase [Penicillium malachiteum]|uniref:Terpenoid synthase n=1 Tax=Penicillium malachiteum TaxID=1324776 RepID=A0AAD6HGI1_9EURO|nr:terpenoid synthase [Penicillium malachiteum]